MPGWRGVWGLRLSFLLFDDASHPSPVNVDRQEVLRDGEVHGGQESCLDGEGLGELYLLLLLDVAGPSPVDVDRQEVLEDGEVFDQDRSFQDGSYQDDEAPSRFRSHSRSYAS